MEKTSKKRILLFLGIIVGLLMVTEIFFSAATFMVKVKVINTTNKKLTVYQVRFKGGVKRKKIGIVIPGGTQEFTLKSAPGDNMVAVSVKAPKAKNDVRMSWGGPGKKPYTLKISLSKDGFLSFDRKLLQQ